MIPESTLEIIRIGALSAAEIIVYIILFTLGLRYVVWIKEKIEHANSQTNNS